MLILYNLKDVATDAKYWLFLFFNLPCIQGELKMLSIHFLNNL